MCRVQSVIKYILVFFYYTPKWYGKFIEVSKLHFIVYKK